MKVIIVLDRMVKYLKGCCCTGLNGKIAQGLLNWFQTWLKKTYSYILYAFFIELG